ncbi:MAG: ABC-type transport auxiliary lipoprotein family protein, partial [Verrucomicrobiia bacterium]
GVNLSSLLSSDRVVLSAWQRSEVKAEVYLAVQRFECNAQGQVILEARWRITSPGGEKTLRTDHTQITRQGPVFRTDADGAVGELSKALADLSRQIATSVQSISVSPKVSQP